MMDALQPRPTFPETFMEVARSWAKRSTCTRRMVGCVIATADGDTLLTGYNGSLSKTPHCSDVGCLLHNDRCVRCVHAEANAVARAAKRGIALDGAVAYVTAHPCPTCLILLATAGVRKVYYGEPYHETEQAIAAALVGDLVERIYFGGQTLAGGML